MKLAPGAEPWRGRHVGDRSGPNLHGTGRYAYLESSQVAWVLVTTPFPSTIRIQLCGSATVPFVVVAQRLGLFDLRVLEVGAMQNRAIHHPPNSAADTGQSLAMRWSCFLNSW